MTAPNVNAPPNSNPTPPASTSGALTSPTAGQPTPNAPASSNAAAQDTGFRYGPGVADFLVGKTAQEAADLAARLYEQNKALAQQAWQRPAQPPQPGYQPSMPAPAYGA